jgi:hypothetical protein
VKTEVGKIWSGILQLAGEGESWSGILQTIGAGRFGEGKLKLLRE